MIQSMNMVAWMSLPGGMEWVIILAIMLLIFGKRLPELARSVGKSMTEFKKGINEAKESTDELVDDVKKIGSDAVSDGKSSSGVKD